ncbi:MAG TPA: SLBB domain-containing protein [Gemmatimonadales bacterium]|nr:SLBB domain-containing protein [Gemmatimonadales bacterium]
MNPMLARLARVSRLVEVTAVLAFMPLGLVAAQDGKDADRPLATREELQAALQRAGSSDEGARIKTRLVLGDFKRGDRIALMVQGEPALTDTFTVSGNSELILPPPTTGALSLKGVLRSELEPKVTQYIAQFRNHPVVRAQPLLRLSVQGEVAKGGIYAVPADAQLADALMAAGGTTQYAKTNQVTIERNGRKIWHGSAFDTDIDALNLQDGDQITVGGNRPSGSDNLRTVALLVSIAGGLYGLSRAIH